MSVVHFGEQPYAVRLMPLNVPIEQATETEEVCPLLAVEGNQGLVVRQRELLWWPLDRIRVVLQPTVETPEEEPPPLGPAPTV